MNDISAKLRIFKEGGIFEQQIKDPNKLILYSFCKKILQNKFITDSSRGGGRPKNYYDIFFDSYPFDSYQNIQNLNTKELNIFLNFLRVYNPPIEYETIQIYTDTLLDYCYTLVLVDSLDYELDDPKISLLFKFINEIAYEKASLEFFPHKKYNYIDHYTNTLDSLNDKLASSVFEEIIFQLIPEALYSIHLPQAGDILLRDGNTMEIKKNNNPRNLFPKFIKSAKKAKENNIYLLSGIGGGNTIQNIGDGNVYLSYKRYEFPTVHKILAKVDIKHSEITIKDNNIFNNGRNIAPIKEVFTVIPVTEDITEIYRNMTEAFKFAYRYSGIKNIYQLRDLEYILTTDNNIRNYIFFPPRPVPRRGTAPRRGASGRGTASGRGAYGRGTGRVVKGIKLRKNTKKKQKVKSNKKKQNKKK